jgi:hypothetical protein
MCSGGARWVGSMLASGRGARLRLLVLTVGLLALSAAALAGSAAAALPMGCVQSGSAVTCSFSFTGSEQTFVVPAGVRAVRVNAVGAPGGSTIFGAPIPAVGEGAAVQATVPLPPGTSTLYVEVGGTGGESSFSGNAVGGFNGGGGDSNSGGGGGGASDVRTCSSATCSDLSTDDTRLVVAGGGGGVGLQSGNGGTAGDLTVTGAGNGADAAGCFTTTVPPGGNGGFGRPAGLGGTGDGDTPTPGDAGVLGQGGSAAGGAGGGGGGGYFGGGGGGNPGFPNCNAGAGGAGSSFWVSDATDTSMTEDTTGTPSVTITYTFTSTTVSAPATGAAGTAIPPSSISATLSGAFTAPTGTIGFTVFGPQSSPPSDCTSGGTTLGTATVSGNGTYHPSAGFTPTSAGTYWWYASYSGDDENQPSNSGCGPGMKSTMIAAPPTVQITAPGDEATYVQGQPVSSSFTCNEGANGPGLLSCLDQNGRPSGSAADTSAVGSHTFTVTATSKDGQTSSKSVTYQVAAQTGPPPPPTNRFVVKHIKVHANGLVSFDVKVPGAGAINVLETAWKNNFATAATLLQPATGRFVFARSDRTAGRGSTLHFKVKPNKQGRRLVAHHRYKVRIRLWVTYQPTGGTQRKIGFYGLRITR